MSCGRTGTSCGLRAWWRYFFWRSYLTFLCFILPLPPCLWNGHTTPFMDDLGHSSWSGHLGASKVSDGILDPSMFF